MQKPSDEKIRLRAYEIWDQEGRPEGHDGEHWLRAQREFGLVPAEGGESSASAERPDDTVEGNVTRISAGDGTSKRSQAAG